MAMTTEEKIRHYQRSIDRSVEDKERLLHCIGMLSKLPVTVQHLHNTGIGRTVNALRKIEEGVGDAAKCLVAKWRYMVTNTNTSEEEDEACVPDVPECYESPECESEPDSNKPTALRVPPPEGSPIVFDEDSSTDSHSHSASNGKIIHSDDGDEEAEVAHDKHDNHDLDDNTHEEEQTTRSSSSKDKHASKSSKHSSKSSSKDKCSKKELDKSKTTYKHKDKHDHKHKHKSSRVSKSDKESESSDHKLKDRTKSKSESSQSSTSSASKEKKHTEESKKRKHDSSSSDEESYKKKKIKLSSDEEYMDEDNFVIDAGRSLGQGEQENIVEDHKEKKRSSSSHSKTKESSLKGESQSDKSKSKDEHRSSNSNFSKTKSSSDTVKKDERYSTSKSDERGKENKSKSDEHRSKESSKSKTSHRSSSNSSKDKEKDRDKDKHSKDKAKESSSKSQKDDKEKSKSKDKEHKSKSKDNEKDHKKHKESKENDDSKEHKEKKKVKKTASVDGGIDCNSGTSFADALGMCTMLPPSSKKKKENTTSNLPKSSKTEKHNNSSLSTPTSSSSRASTSKINNELPDSPESLPLLSPNVKLEPLRIEEEVDLSSTLPEPSLNYKPMPQICPAERRRNEDQMLSQVIYAKNQRTKVFSGNKTGYTSVPTLNEMCIRVLIENIDALEYTGGVPYYIIKPVLERATPDQLFILEHHNPYLTEESDSLWQFHCNKDFRTKVREEMETWREMYMRCLDEREAKLKALTANIKQSIDKSAPVRSTKLAYVDNVVKPPRSVLRKQAKYGTANSSSKSSDIKKKIIAAAAGPRSGASSDERISVPAPPNSRARMSSSSTIKKTKAPLMAKALQAIKGRYKR